MKAILLAAGTGSRIVSDIGDQPKSLLPVEGKPILLRTLKLLDANGIQTSIVTGYHHEMIEDIVRDFPVQLFYNPFYEHTNSIGSLWMARDALFADELLIANADVFITQELLNLVQDTTHDVFMLYDKSRINVGDYFFKSEGEKLKAYGKDLPLEERSGEYVGVACLRNEWVRRFRERLTTMIEKQREYGCWWEDVLYSFVAENEHIHTVDVEERFWAEVDTLADYQRILTYCQMRREPPALSELTP